MSQGLGFRGLGFKAFGCRVERSVASCVAKTKARAVQQWLIIGGIAVQSKEFMLRATLRLVL